MRARSSHADGRPRIGAHTLHGADRIRGIPGSVIRLPCELCSFIAREQKHSDPDPADWKPVCGLTAFALAHWSDPLHLGQSRFLSFFLCLRGGRALNMTDRLLESGCCLVRFCWQRLPGNWSCGSGTIGLVMIGGKKKINQRASTIKYFI